jgi:hypothetical protein
MLAERKAETLPEAFSRLGHSAVLCFDDGAALAAIRNWLEPAAPRHRRLEP